jgi:hypothetical protein
MLYYLTAAGLIAHTYFWGLGLAWLVLPRVWRSWWWVFAPGLGLGLQSAVVWAGAHTPLAGTDAYAYASELLPAGLIALAFRRGRLVRPRGGAGLLLVALLAGWMLVSPMTQPGRGLTVSSLGSCDSADYAAGARVFQEFSRNDRTGFLGLPEVTHVRSADYFFDFWLRLNHFTPSALLAHNASVFGVEAYRLVSVSAAVLVVLCLPLVLFLARVVLGLRGGWLLGLAAVYGFSPLNAYAVHQGALGQLYAAQGIALLTLVVIGADRAMRRGRALRPYLILIFAAFWLLAGSYNFILTVCLAPAGAWLVAQLAVRRDWPAFGRMVGLIGLGLAACVVFFWGRFSGLIERFSLFEQYDFGWVVPLASPEGWLGVLRDTELHAWPVALRVLLSAAALALWGYGLRALWRTRRGQALAALALVLPVIAGWAMLARSAQMRPNASYDAYKLLAVFYPGLLAGLCCWLVAVPRGVRGAALLLVLAANLSLAVDFRRQMAAPPLRVDRSLAELGRLESDARIGSLNMVVDDYWSRLWANAFLLRKAQYFAIHTYEGRLNTALKGEWDLSDSLLRLPPLLAEDFLPVNERFHLVRAAAPGRLRANFAEGWQAEEHAGALHWRWSDGAGRILVTNPADHPVEAELRLRGRGIATGRLVVRLEQHQAGSAWLDGTLQDLHFESLLLQPGRTVLTIESPAAPAGAGDARTLAFALHGFELHTVALQK